jgi:hypothetical protein
MSIRAIPFAELGATVLIVDAFYENCVDGYNTPEKIGELLQSKFKI